MLRPCSGRFTTCLVSIVSERTLVSVSTSGDSPCTVTVCCVVPIFSTALISVVRPVCTCTLSKICVSKPVFATVNWYRPKVTEVNENAPLACVVPFCTTFVSRSFSSSPAAGTAAPAGSVTVTLTTPADPAWLYATGAVDVHKKAMPQDMAANVRNCFQRVLCIEETSFAIER